MPPRSHSSESEAVEVAGARCQRAGASRRSRASARDIRSAARREAILAAALDEFSAQGFAAARLDDVAKRAGVAKGTIYLYFADKETLFQELARSMLTPLIGQFRGAGGHRSSRSPMLAERLVDGGHPRT